MKVILPIIFGTSTGIAANLFNPHISNVGLVVAMSFGIISSYITRLAE